MEDTRYIISDASKMVDVEQHTLRYWEDELKLDIERSGLGHRLYSEEDISTFKKIKALKDQGFQLKAIKMILPDIDKMEMLDPTSLLKLKEKMNEETGEYYMNEMPKSELITNQQQHIATAPTADQQDRMGQFRTIMKDIMSDVLKENNVELSDSVSMNVTNSVIKEMDYLLRMKEEQEEARFKKFDQLLREYQNSKSHVAAAKEKKRKHKLFNSREM